MGLSSGSCLYWVNTISYLLYICQITWNYRRCWQPKSQNTKSEIWGLFVPICKMHHYCSGESGGSITTSEPHLELTATWLYTIKTMFYEHLYMNQQESILCCCQFLDVFTGGWAERIVIVLNIVLSHCYYHKSCTNLNVWCFDPSLHTSMHACKCAYASCEMHIYTSCYTYVM